jgi:cell division protein FtsB
VSAKRKSPRGRTVLWAIVGGAALYFAIQGGEYGTGDLIRQRLNARALRTSIDSLHHAVDSLKRQRDKIRNDPREQERIGREEFGWVRGDKELLYRLAGPDTTRPRP